jgi:hypothetical protein
VREQEGPSPVELIRERRWRRAEASGEPFEERPFELHVDDQNGSLSVADITAQRGEPGRDRESHGLAETFHPGISLDRRQEARSQDRVHEDRVWRSRIPDQEVAFQIEAATCEGGGFFLFGAWDPDPPCCGAIPKHFATTQDLSPRSSFLSAKAISLQKCHDGAAA